MNGLSYRLFIKHTNANKDCYRDSLYRQYIKAWEREKRDCTADAVVRFYARACSNRNKVVYLIQKLVGEGASVWVYGASTKGNFILQWYGLDNSLIDGAADRSPEKHGLYTVGTGIPIWSEEKGRKFADYFLVLPYAFIDEFVEREKEWLANGGKFIVPLPELRLIPDVS